MQLTSRLRYLGYCLPCLALASACERRGFSLSDDVPIASGPTVTTGGFTAVAGSSGVSGGGGVGPANPCTLNGNSTSVPLFADQTISHLQPARKELYALVTQKEAEALRAGAPLVPPPESGAIATTLGALLQPLRSSTSEQRRRLGENLVPRFRVVRATWPNPWALRLVDHPGSEPMSVVRIVVRDEALFVRLSSGAAYVVDLNNADVPLEVALAQPERIAAIYYQLDRNQPGSGVADRCENGMREVALGNEAMVEEWSLGTEEIQARRAVDIGRLTSLFDVSRNCPSSDGVTSFRASVACETWLSFSSSTENLAYQWSLSTPVEPYKPTPQNLATLIQALKDDPADLEPFVVKPEPPTDLSAGGGGGGGEGGAAQEGGAPGRNGGGQGGAL